MEHVMFIVSYDETLTNDVVLATALWEVGGVENIKVKDGD